MPCNIITSQKNRLAMLVASFVLLHRMKCAILLNLSTNTKMLVTMPLRFWQSKNKIHANVNPRFTKNIQRCVKSMLLCLRFSFFTFETLLAHFINIFSYFQPIKMFAQHSISFKFSKIPHKSFLMSILHK